jgi:site-specific recombinase XerD
MLLDEGKKRFLQYMDTIDRSLQTIDGYGKDLKLFGKFLSTQYNCEPYVEDVTSSDIESFLLFLKEERNYAPASRSRNLYTLRSFFSWAYKKEIVDRDVALSVENIKLQQKERVFLRDEEVEELLTMIEHPLINLAVRTLYMTGFRISECLNLTMKTVDLESRVIHVIAGKGNKDRLVPISDKLYPYLKKYIDMDRPAIATDNFFATTKTGKLSPQYVNYMLAIATKKLGWTKKVSCHILRHSFASRLVDQDVNLVQIQKLLGHSSLKVTSIYTHSNIDKLKSAVNAM